MKSKKHNEGFTITELLVIVAIMLSVLGIAIFGYSKISKQFKINAREEVYHQVESAAEDFFSINEYLKNDISEEKIAYVSVGKLVSTDYMSVVTDPVTEKQLDNCTIVKVSKQDAQLEYKVVRDETEKELVQSIIGTNNTSCEYEPFIMDSNMPRLTIELYKRDTKGNKTGEPLEKKIFLSGTEALNTQAWNISSWFNLNKAPNGLIVELKTSDKSSINYSTTYTKSENVSSAASGTIKSGTRIAITKNDSLISLETKFGLNNTVTTLIKLDNQRPSCQLYAYGQIKNATRTATGFSVASQPHYTMPGTLTSDLKWYTSNVNVLFKSVGDNISVSSRTIDKYFDSARGSSLLTSDTQPLNFTGYVFDPAGNMNKCSLWVKKDATTPTSNLNAYFAEHSIINSLDTTSKVDTAISNGTVKLLSTNTWTNQSVVLRNKPTDSLSKLKETVCVDQRDGSTFTDFRRVGNSSQGTFYFYCSSVDYAGNLSSINYITKRDITPPTINISSRYSKVLSEVSGYTAPLGYAGAWYSGYASVEASIFDTYQETAVTYTRTPDATLGGSGTKTKTTTVSAGNTALIRDYSEKEGISTYTFKACDKLQNCTTKSFVVRLDRTAPVCSLTLNGTKGNLYNVQWYKTNVGLTFSCTDNMKTINLQGLNAGSYIYNNLTTGTQSDETSNVRWCGIARDNAYNVTTKSAVFGVDKTKPQSPTYLLKEIKDDNSIFVRTNANTWTKNKIWWGDFSAKDVTTADSSIGGSGIAKLEYSTSCSGTATNVLSSSYTYSSTRDSYYCIRSVDNAGWESAWSKPVYIKVDKTAPTVPRTMNFVYGDWSVYGGGWTYKTLYAGRTSSSPAPTGSTDSHSGLAKYQISKDKLTWCDYLYNTSDEMYVMRTTGTHYRYFRAVDKVGNVSDLLTKVGKIDTSTPTLSIVLKKEGTTTTVASDTWSNANVTYTATDSVSHISGVTTTCTMSSPNSETKSGETSVTSTATIAGTTTVSCTSKTGAGKSKTASATIKIDKAKPAVKISLAKEDGTAIGSNVWSNQNVKVSAVVSTNTISIASTPTCTMTGATTGTFTGTTTIQNAGTTTISCKTTNGARTSSDTVTSVVKIDKTIPSLAIVLKKEGTTTTVTSDTWSNTNVTYTASVSNSSSISSGVTTTCTMTGSTTGSGTTNSTNKDGITNVSCTSKTGAGNSKTASAVMKVDKVAPTCSISRSGTAGNYNGVQWYKSNVGLTLGYSDNTSGIASKGLASGSYSYNNVASGTQSAEIASVTWYGIVKDNAGNECKTSTIFGVDKTAPTCSISRSGTAGNYKGVQWYKGNVSLTLGYSDNIGVASKGLASGSYSYNNVASGTQSAEIASVTWYGIVKDNAGNECKTSTNFGVDKTAPSCSSNNGSTTWTNQDRTITQTCTDTYSGCTSVVKTFTSDTTTEGITIRDGAGNINTCSANVYVDKTAPTLTVNAYKTTTKTEASGYTAKTSYDEAWYNGWAWVGATTKDNLSTTTLTLSRTKGSVGGSGELTSSLTTSANVESDVLKQWSNAQGESVYTYTACDEAKNCTTSTKYVRLDRTAPTCTLTPTGTKGNKVGSLQWYVSNVSLSLSCNDATSGLNGYGLASGTATYNSSTAGTQSDETASVTWYGIAKDKAGNITNSSLTFGLEKSVTITFEPTLSAKAKSDSSITTAYGNLVFNTSKVPKLCGFGTCTSIKCYTDSALTKKCGKNYFARSCWYVDTYPRFFKITAKSYNSGTTTTVYASDATASSATYDNVKYYKNTSLVRSEKVLRYDTQTSLSSKYYFQTVGESSGGKNDFSAHQYQYTSPAGNKSNKIRLYTEYIGNCGYEYK